METENGQASFDLKKADWKEVTKEVRLLASQTKWYDVQPGNDRAAKLQSIVIDAFKKWIPCKRASDGNNKAWWSRDIEELRSSLKRKTRLWMQYRRDQDRCSFVRARNAYNMTVRRAKQETWFNQAVKDEAEDPWGKIY